MEIFIRPYMACPEQGIQQRVPQADFLFIQGCDDPLADVRLFCDLLDDFGSDEIHPEVLCQLPTDLRPAASRIP